MLLSYCVLVAGRHTPAPTTVHPDSLAAREGDRCPGFVTCPPPLHLPYNSTDYPTSYAWVPGRKFPADFTWALGTASYQIEGAYNEDGRGASIWDTFTGANTVGMPGSVCSAMPCSVSSVMIHPGATGNVANDHYHLYERDVEALASFGLTSYRFSIAWPRIFPTGKSALGPNAKGVAFYHRLLDALLAKNIEPIVTIYHWDLPQGLIDAAPGRDDVKPCDDRFAQGWFACKYAANGTTPVPLGAASPTAKEYVAFATFLLKEYGGKVKKWLTFNEPWTFTALGSGGGKAPSVQPYMDATIWPYVAGHNVILAHLEALKAFRALQQAGSLSKEAVVGITNNQDWREPLEPGSPTDIAAAHVMLEGQLGWFADPIYGYKGTHDYPQSMRRLLPYLPSFTPSEQADLAQHRPDFFGLNHYGTGFAKSTHGVSSVIEDGIVAAQSTWLFGAAWGFRQLLNYVARRYPGYPIYVTESGWSVSASNSLEAKYDSGRLEYYYSYLTEAYAAIVTDKVPLVAFDPAHLAC